MECTKVASGVRKANKKHVKNELDRMKLAEKKKRRLEKALATSAAIRSELEKKKLKKKQEQDRLDEESAAIAEAVALQVLLGEDSDNSGKVMLNKDEGLTMWDRSNINIIVGERQRVACGPDLTYSCENVARVPDAHHYGRMWNLRGNPNLMISPVYLGSGFYPQYLGQDVWGPVGLCAGHLAAQAVSAVRIAEDERVDVRLQPYLRRVS